MVLSRYGRPIPMVFFFAVYIRCIWKMWDVVAHNQTSFQPPDVRPIDGPFVFWTDLFHLQLRQSPAAVVNWNYAELYVTLNLIAGFAAKYGMWEMDVEVVAAGVGAFGGTIRYIGPPGS